MKLINKVLMIILVIIVGFFGVYGYLAFNQYNIRKNLAIGIESYEKGNPQAAILFLKNVYEKSPDSPKGIDALYYLGESYMSTGKILLAKVYCEKLLGLDRAEQYQPKCLFNLAIIAEEQGDGTDMVKYLKVLTKKYSDSDLIDDALWKLASRHKANNELVEAKSLLTTIVEQYPGSNIIATVQKELGALNVKLLFSSYMTSDSVEYIVKKGDTIDSIARSFGANSALVKRSNNLKSDFLKIGQRLKIVNLTFSIVVDKARNTLLLKADENVIKIYLIGTGVEGCTPVGEFVITNKMIHPPWYKSGEGVVPYGDSRNVLGTRWMGFDLAGYGIHGTWEPDTIGTQSSAGCIRMLNEEVEELFDIVPVGTTVTIIE